MRFSRVYSELVLAQNFAEGRRLFFQQLMDIQRAHLVMLVRCGILSQEQGRALGRALALITWERVESIRFDGSFEDLFCCLEGLLAEDCGPDLAGRLHTARSRNDIDVTLYRLRWREELSVLVGLVAQLRGTLVTICEREKESLIPVYTHTQPAQPSTLAHYFLGIAEHLERDHDRLSAALRTMNRSPLGSCAATGTGFPIDRELAAKLLAFDGPTGNTYSSIAAADYLLEAVGAAMVLLNLCSRLLQDLLLWSMREFQFVRIADGLVQPSSIMPQKRNPVGVEHARALAGRALGRASACFQMLHNTPYGDIVDIEDDLQPLVDSLFQDAARVVLLLSEILDTADFDRERLADRAAANWITVTELADTLVREEGLAFRQAHAVVAEMVRECETEEAETGAPPQLSPALREASRRLLGGEIEWTEDKLRQVLSPRHFVEQRAHLGGPARPEIERALSAARQRLQKDHTWIETTIRHFREFRVQLQKEVEEL